MAATTGNHAKIINSGKSRSNNKDLMDRPTQLPLVASQPNVSSLRSQFLRPKN
jgi:hypothetical protein